MSVYVIAGEQADVAVGNDKELAQPVSQRLEQDSAVHVDLTTTATGGSRVVVLEVLDAPAGVVLGSITLEAGLAGSQTNVIHLIFPTSADGELPFPVPAGGALRVRDTADIDVLDTFAVRLFYNRVGPVIA